MGGYGSGRWGGHDRKTTVEECVTLDVLTLARDGVLGRSGGAGALRWTSTARGEETASASYRRELLDELPVLRLLYSVTRRDAARHEVDLPIPLQTTHSPVGGERWWFTCPLVAGGRPCRRRVRKLYRPPGARYFGCRRCHDLTYTSSQESHRYDGVVAMLARDTGFDPAFVKRALARTN